MFFNAGIDPHDLNVKVKKVITFLGKGHPVKVGIIAKVNDEFPVGWLKIIFS